MLIVSLWLIRYCFFAQQPRTKVFNSQFLTHTDISFYRSYPKMAIFWFNLIDPLKEYLKPCINKHLPITFTKSCKLHNRNHIAVNNVTIGHIMGNYLYFLIICPLAKIGTDLDTSFSYSKATRNSFRSPTIHLFISQWVEIISDFVTHLLSRNILEIFKCQ